MLEISEAHEQGILIVRPTGKLDTLTAREFESHLGQRVENGDGPLLVDMAGIDYVSSFGLRSILIIAKRLAPFGRKFILFSTNPSVHEVLRVSGFLKIVTVEETMEAALQAAAAADGAA